MTETKPDGKESELVQAGEAVGERKGKSSKPTGSKNKKERARRSSKEQETTGNEETSPPRKKDRTATVEAVQQEPDESAGAEPSTKHDDAAKLDSSKKQVPNDKDGAREGAEAKGKKAKSKREKRRSSRSVGVVETGLKEGSAGERESDLKSSSPSAKEKSKAAKKDEATVGSERQLKSERAASISDEGKAKKGERDGEEEEVRAGSKSKSKSKRRLSKGEENPIGATEATREGEVDRKGQEEEEGGDKSEKTTTPEGEVKTAKKERRNSKHSGAADESGAVGNGSTVATEGTAKTAELPAAVASIATAPTSDLKPKRRRSKDAKKGDKDLRRESTNGKKERRRSSGSKKVKVTHRASASTVHKTELANAIWHQHDRTPPLANPPLPTKPMEPAVTPSVDVSVNGESGGNSEKGQDGTETGKPISETMEENALVKEAAKFVGGGGGESSWVSGSDKENVKEETKAAGAGASADPHGRGDTSTAGAAKESPPTAANEGPKGVLPPVTTAVAADPETPSTPAQPTIPAINTVTTAGAASITLPVPESTLPASAGIPQNKVDGDGGGSSVGESARGYAVADAGEETGSATISPTPPRKRSNPIARGTPPHRGSRGGNLTISTQQQQGGLSTGRGDGTCCDGEDRPRPISPRSRPRNMPLVSAKHGLRGGQDDSSEGDGGDADGNGKNGEKETAKAFSSRRWKASDEYVLDEDRETPRGGVFAKIPGLEQHMAVEAKRMNDPPRFRSPKLISGTVRMYDQEDASAAAFRYPECRGAVFRPSYADDGSFDDLPAGSPLLSEPPHKLRLERARGYHGGGFYPSTDNNAYFLGENRMPKGGGRGNGGTRGSEAGIEKATDETADILHRFEVVYPTAALVVMQEFRVHDRSSHESGGTKLGSETESATRAGGTEGRGGSSEATWWGQERSEEVGGGEATQRFFDGHTDDVTAVAVHPGGVLVASGQVRRNPPVLVWTSSAACSKGTAVLNKQKATIATLKGHERKICCLDFSPDGWLLCSVGADCKSTTNVWDWRKGVAIAKVQAGAGPIHAFRFNPYQCYGVPSKTPLPGQALHVDDACYCMVSIGVRHSKFWLLTRGVEEPSRDEIPPVIADAKWTTSQRVHEERDKGNKGRGNLTWILDGSAARLNGKGNTADFTCMTFIDDSPLLRTWGANNAVIDSPDSESDRTSGRVVLGTAAGDLYVFIQRCIRLIPREFAKAVKQGKGGRGIFLDPWWLFGPGHEVTANKRLWDLGAELVENIPHSMEAANEVMLSDKAKERVRALEQKMAVKPLHPAVFEELKRQHDRFSYTGPLTGHDGGVSALAFNRETGKVVSAGADGEIVQWQAFFFDQARFLAPVRRGSSTAAAREAAGSAADGNASTGVSASAPGSKGGATAGAAAPTNSSLVGLINARRDRQEDKLQKSLRSRDPSEPRLLRLGHEIPRGDGRVGGVDVFELDYQTTLGREDDGETFLSDFDDSTDRKGDSDGTEPSRVDMFGACGKVDGLEFSGIGGGNESRPGAAGGGSRRGSRDAGDREGSDGVRFQLEAGITDGEASVDFRFSGEKGRERPGTSPFGEMRRDSGAAEERQAAGGFLGGGQGQGMASSRRSNLALFPRGSHCKSLVWSLDGKRLLTGVNTNVLLLLRYPKDDAEPSSDKRVVAVSPRGRSQPQQTEHAGNGSGFSSNGDKRSKQASVTPLVQGHSGSVMALAVFEGVPEYVTAGYDRSVAIWNAASNLPVAWCHHLPSPISCVACSPDLEQVAIGTVNTNEILFLKVHRQATGDSNADSLAQATTAAYVGNAAGADAGHAGASSHYNSGSTSSGGTNTNPAIGIELYHSKQLLPASAWARRRPPGPNSRWITTAPSWDRSQIVTLDGKDTPHLGGGGGAASNGAGGGGGHAASPHKPQTASTKASPVRARATSASQATQSLSPTKSPSRPPTFGTVPGFGDGGGAGFVGDDYTKRGRRRNGDGGGEPSRGMGASCMRYSPSGSHLAIGCKNGSLVIMAVETENKRGGGGAGDRTSNDHDTDLSGHHRKQSRSEERADRDRGGHRSGTRTADTRIKKEDRENEVGAESSAYAGSGGGGGGGGESSLSPSFRRKKQSRHQRRKAYRRIAHLKGHSSRVLHVDWTVDGRFVHTCGQDYQLLHWEILPPPPGRQEEGAPDGPEEQGTNSNESGRGDGEDDADGVAGEFRPRMFKRAFLVRDERWATWSSTIGWPVQGVFPPYSDNSDVNAVDLCADRDLLAAADDAKTVRLLRYPVLRGGARNRSYTGHSSHVMGARFTIGTDRTRLITLGGMDSTVLQWVVEDAPPR